MPHSSPFQQLFEDDTQILIENLIPYCDKSSARFLAIHLKLRELQKIFFHFDDAQTLHTCDIQSNPNEVLSMLSSLKGSLSKEKGMQIDQLIQMIKTVQGYQKFMNLSKENPELFSFVQKFLQGDTTNSEQSKKILELLSATQGNSKEFQDLFSFLFHNHS